MCSNCLEKAITVLQLEDASAAFTEAQDIVKQLKDALKEKRAAISSAERDLAPVIDEADQIAAEVTLYPYFICDWYACRLSAITILL